MKRYFNKISGKKTTSKIVKTGLILATVGTIVFGVMFGEQVYQSVEDMYKNTKAKTVSVYQNAKSSIEQSFEERANKIELKKQEKQEKQQDAIPPRLEIQKNAPIETGSMVDISLGAMENAEKLKNEKPASIQKKNVEIKNIEENIPVQTFIPVTDEKKIAPMPGLSLGAVQSKINSSVESVAPSENAEKQIMGKRTMSVKETTSSMGQVVSKNVDTIVKDVYSDGTESQERKSNFSYDLNDTNKEIQPVVEMKSIAPEVAKEDSLAKVESVAHSETSEKIVVGTKTETFKTNNIRMGQIVSQNITRVVTSIYSDGTESKESTTSLSYDLSDTNEESQPAVEVKSIAPEVAKEDSLAKVESFVPSENAEKQIVGKRTMSVKETSSSMGQVVSKNVDTIVKDVYSDGTESQERKSNFSYDLNDTNEKSQPAVEMKSISPEVAIEIAPKNLEENSAVVTIENKYVVSTESEVTKVTDISIKETTYSKGEVVTQNVTTVKTDVNMNGVESTAIFTISEQTETPAEKEFSFNMFEKSYSLENFCADFFRNRILEDFIKKSGGKITLKYIDSKGNETTGKINSIQLCTIYDAYSRKSQNSVFYFGEKSFSFDNNGKILTPKKENLVSDIPFERYLDDTNFRLGVNVLAGNLSGYNPTPFTSSANNPNIMQATELSNFNSQNMRLYYNFDAGYYFPVSRDIKGSISSNLFGVKDFSNNFSVFGGELQGDMDFYVKNGIISLYSGVGYTSNSTLFGNLGVSYDTMTKNNNLVGVYAEINSLRNTVSHDNSIALSAGAHISFGGKSKKNASSKELNDSFQKSALDYDIKNRDKKPYTGSSGQTQNPTNPNSPTINPPFDDGLGGMEQGL